MLKNNVKKNRFLSTVNSFVGRKVYLLTIITVTVESRL